MNTKIIQNIRIDTTNYTNAQNKDKVSWEYPNCGESNRNLQIKVVFTSQSLGKLLL